MEKLIIYGAIATGVGLLIGASNMVSDYKGTSSSDAAKQLSTNVSKNTAAILFSSLVLLLCAFIYYTAYPEGMIVFITILTVLSMIISLIGFEVSAIFE